MVQTRNGRLFPGGAFCALWMLAFTWLARLLDQDNFSSNALAASSDDAGF